jgi:uncharacterized cysteine cluster protein YcgN (CxxCxxCC family)
MVMKKKSELPFWKRKSLWEMTCDEWESLCDGCSKCCLQKVEYEDTGEVYYTRVVCRYMDQKTCRCTRYEQRTQLVPDCLKLEPENVRQIHFLPRTCAYRLIAETQDLEWWHSLVSGDPDTVHEAGISVRGKVLSEEYVHPEGLEEHIIEWVKT